MAGPEHLRISVLAPDLLDEAAPVLGEILARAVRSGAGVNFVLPFTADDGREYWRARWPEVAAGDRVILLATLDSGADGELAGGVTPAAVVGTVSLLPARMPNQPHRADISKLLVHPEHRRTGVATALMAAAEAQARRTGRTLLTLDCVSGGHEEAFYRGLGYRVVGTVPGYALSPTGQLEGATFLYKDLGTDD